MSPCSHASDMSDVGRQSSARRPGDDYAERPRQPDIRQEIRIYGAVGSVAGPAIAVAAPEGEDTDTDAPRERVAVEVRTVLLRKARNNRLGPEIGQIPVIRAPWPR